MESLVEGSLVRLLKSRGIDVTDTFPNVRKGFVHKNGDFTEKEFDIIVANGTEVVVVEVKTVLTQKAVRVFIKEQLNNFKKYFPRYRKNVVLYGAVAFLRARSRAAQAAEKAGLFVVKATGDSASLVNKKNFKPRVFD